jgi:serine/threonine protein phosphatase PrpC
MEDAHVLNMNFNDRGWVFGGVYDGHNGYFAARYSARHLHRIFLRTLHSGLSPQESFIFAYEEVSRRLQFQDSGTTAVTFLIRDGHIITANAGDARAIVTRDRDAHQLTIDHRVMNQDELTRIFDRGGTIRGSYVVRGSEGLMPTRTIGDEYFKPVGIISTPAVNSHEISEKDLFLIAACDGLFDVMKNEEVGDIAGECTEPDQLLDRLKIEVLVNRCGLDNLSIIAVSLQDKGIHAKS